MDVLRRAAGTRRPGRWWDRGMWFCALAVAAFGVSIGGSSLADQLRSQPESARVLFCQTEPHLYGRWLGSRTTCAVMTGRRTVEMETERWHPPGRELSLRSSGDTVLDPALNRDQVWWLPVGVLVGAVTWWIGLPPRTDLAYGRHAASRERRCRATRR
ncbi:hypothetical protein SAMN06272737_12926 [Blastococcus mobilis]|uniref:Uncharacterized protein n=1 Tax=Blastococcus mobilis TaxID=1938746 RepID=A0A238ZJA1_9ACTN|nr:hypothetical protein SAMN06272737_12926 [Blastococcus mobilis]